jgi:formylglycine-generating enzyme required for sulfatase activity
LWQAVMGSNPSSEKGLDLPVQRVSWNDTQEFIRKLNAMFGGASYRLPTEAEWEYACRAGSTEAEYGKQAEIAWCRQNSFNQPNPVGQKKPNAWTLFDMLGNVWEWCQDWYDSYPLGSAINPTGPPSGFSRVVRGGAYNWEDCRSATREAYEPESRLDYLGFRLARSCS